jgi:hypothetical protein
VLYREEERRSRRCTAPLLLTIEYMLHSLSSISRLDWILHQKDEEHATYSIVRRRGGEEECTIYFYFSSPTHDWVCIIFLDILPMMEGGWKVRRRLPPPS